jgi:ATP-binding cassette subfamily B protein
MDIAAAVDDDANPTPRRLPGYGGLLRMLRPVHAHLLACATLSGLAAASGLLPFIAIAELGRMAIAGELPAATVWSWVGVGVAGAISRLLLLFASSRIGHYADAELLHRLRQRIVGHLGVLPLGWFRATGSGVVKKTMTDDLEDMHQLIAHSLGEVVAATVSIVVGLGYLALVDWRMMLVTGTVMALIAISYRIAMRSMTSHLLRLIAAEGRIGAASVEYADGIAVVKTFGSEGRILDRFARAVADYKNAMHDWVTETRFSSSASRLFASEMTVLGAVLGVGLILVHGGEIDMGQVLPFLVVGIGLPTAITPAIQGSQGLRKGRMSAAHIENLLARKALPEPRTPLQPQGYRLEVDDVSFSYDGEVRALEHVSVVCEPGTVTAIVGPSGSGKTTFASLVPRFYDVGGGAIRIGGVDVRSMDAATLLSSLALVFQDVVLLRDTVRENIRIGCPHASDAEVRAAARAARIDAVIEALPQGYDTVLDALGGGLSGGERQRLTIARAILSGAPIVILDEATASLDPDNEVAVQQALAALTRGKTLVVIAHRLHTIMHADQIVVLDRGRIFERGTHDDLLSADGTYARMWSAQYQGARP